MAILAALWGWVTKLVGGWLPIGTKPIGEYLGKILWCVGIVLVVLIVWNRFTKPTTNTVIKPDQHAEQICNTYHQQQLKPGFGGCASFKVYEYYKKEKEEAQK